MRIIGNDQTKTRETSATASGTLPNGKPVIINTDGTVSVASETSYSESLSSGTLFNNNNTIRVAAGFDSVNNKVVIAYYDYGTTSGQAIVGTVSGDTISFGTQVQFSSNVDAESSISFDTANEKVVLFYRDNGNSNYGTAIVGTVSGTSISFGTPVVFASYYSRWNKSCYDSTSGKVIVASTDGSVTDDGSAHVGTVSGTSISFGSAQTYESGSAGRTDIIYDASVDRVVVAYVSGGTVKTKVGTVSGSTISFGSIQDHGGANIGLVRATGDNNGTIFIGYISGNSGSQASAFLATIGTSSITKGTTVNFDTEVPEMEPIYDSAFDKYVILYRTNSPGNNGLYIVGSASGTTLTFESPVTYYTDNAEDVEIAFDSNSNKVVFVYRDSGDGGKGTARVFQNAGSVSNLTANNYIGIAQGEAQIFTQSAGDLVEYHSTDTRGNNAVYDAASGKVVVIFNPAAPTSSPPSGYAIVGTVDPSDNSISYGTLVQFEDGEVYGDYMGITYDSNAEKVVIAYMDTGDSNNSKAIVGTVSGTSISFGTPTTFNGQTQNLTCAFDSTNNKVVIAYKDASNSDYGTAIVGTVSGTDISFGSKVVFNSGNTNNVGICFDSTNDKIIIGYRDQALNQQATAIVGTVSGTSISFGSEVQVSPNSATDCVPIYEPVADKVVFVYSDSSDSNKGTVKIGTVSGTSISFGDAVTFDATSYSEGAGIFDPTSGKVSISYKGASGYAYMTSGTVSGDTITFEDPLQLSTFAAATYRFGCAYDSANSRIVTAFIDSDAVPDTGESIVSQNGYEVRPSTADGNNVLLFGQGGVADNQFSLTAGQSYYVQTDGTLSTTADDPSVFAGTAVSSTKLIVKG